MCSNGPRPSCRRVREAPSYSSRVSASQYDSVSLGTVELVPGFVCFAVRLGGVVGHRGAGAWFWHLVPLLLKVLLHNRAYHGGP